ncbi:MAG: DUF2780 domain-containing protein [Desulfobacterales bacterium]|nr:DUF2780 domain-containing protein [Desulfobacterales bacterium]
MIGKYVPVLLSYTRDKGGDAVSNVLKSALSSACSTNLVGSLSEKLGVSPEQARGGAGAIFDAAKNALGDKDFNKVSDVIPEMDSLLGAAPKGGSGDMLGGVMKSLGGDAEKLAGAASLAGAFSDLGMDSGMIGQYMPIVLSVVESYGGDTVKNLLQSALE